MGPYIARRLLRLVLVMLTVYTLVFAVAHSLPGGPFEEGDLPIEAQALANLRRYYRLDQPLWRQYGENLWAIVRHGDLGPSYMSANRSVNDIIRDYVPVSLQLGLAAMGLAVPARVGVRIEGLLKVDYPALNADPLRTLLLVRDVSGVMSAWEKGLRFTQLNLGNIHFESGRRRVSPSVFLSQSEIDQLKMLVDQGVDVEARAVPSDSRVTFEDMVQRFAKAT